MSAVLVAGSFLFGCATPAKVSHMEIKNTAMAFDPSLSGAIAVDQVKGGEGTNPLWKSKIANSDFDAAVKSSLKSFSLLSEGKQPAYELSVVIVDVEQPSFGFDMKVTSKIRYVLVEKSSGKAVFEETIKAPYVAQFSDAFYGASRLKIATEESAKKNIAEFLKKLSKLNIDKSKIELVAKS
ncbi:hypothetical protein L4C34_05045 [Vibrio profundum]|uniref:hypothetical protein n=1 Tax=Vibrio profundum TaxID=2910247 RepID=UPI003D0DAA39